MRVILYTGKGGVGKTSVAAASASSYAQMGKRVLIMSTDAAHSLSDSFDMKLGREPVRIAEHLDGIEIDTVYESEQVWKNMQDYMKRLLTMRGEGGIETEELLVFPGLEELFSLFKILDYCESQKYDVIVVDCAPTGETLSLLKYPHMLKDFIEKILPMKRKAVKTAGPAVEKIAKIPMPDDSVFDDIDRLMGRMEQLQNLMLDQETLSVRIVTTPEKIVITEAKRNFTCLNLYHYNVDAVIVNKIYPAEAMAGYFNKWISMQEEGIKEIKESFSEVPKFYLELQSTELRTLPNLIAAAHELFKDCQDTSEVLFHNRIMETVSDGDEIVLKLYLPFATKEELDLRQNGNELLIAVKNEHRSFPLSKQLRDKQIKGAKLEDGYLLVRFI